MKRAAVPTPPPGPPELNMMLTALKENIDLLTGRRGDKLTPLASNASLAEVIVALNKVIDRLS